MMTWLWYLVVLTAIYWGNTFKDIAPQGKEAVYTWTADVKAGTHIPASYASQLTLYGRIHLHSRNNSTFVKISNLTYRLYNGIVDNYHEYQTEEVLVPPDNLTNVFEIIYTSQGLVEGIVTEDGEKEFSRNIKNAIATIFQMNLTIFEKEYLRPEAFITQENSIYGHGLVDYTIFPKGGDLEVHKLHDMYNPREMFSNLVTNVKHVTCTGQPEETVMHDSKKIYYIAKRNDYLVTKRIVATGSVVYYPFEARSAAQIILVNQTFNLEEIVPLQWDYHINNEHLGKSLTYNPSEEIKDSDPTSIEEMLIDVTKYLDEDHTKPEVPDSNRGQLINRIQQRLIKFDIEMLQQLQKVLSDDTLHIFYLILPLVRTDASTLFIKNLIVNKAVPDDVAVEMLQHMVENTRPWQHLLPKLEELIYLDKTYSWEVRKAAILTFASLIYGSYISDADEKPYEKYVTEYITKLKSSPDYKSQFMYVLALRNMKLPSLIKKLTPAFNGEWWSNNHLRYMSLWAVTPAIIQSVNPEVAVETLWPVVTNLEETVEMRILSLYIVLQASPTETRLKSIMSYLLEEQNEETYRIYYSVLQTVEQSKNPCIKDLKIRLAQLRRFLPVPKRGTSYVSFYGYSDEKYGFGAEIEYYFVNLNGSRVYVWYYMTQQYNMFQEDYILYVKVHDGKNDNAATAGDPVSDIKQVLDNFKNPLYQNHVHIEAALVKQGQIINVYYFDRTNFLDLIDLLRQGECTWRKKCIHVNYDRYYRGLIPTDLGIPALWEYLMPHISQNKIVLSKSVSDKGLELELGYKYTNWIHYRHGLSFYNPINNVWHGINRYHSYDSVFPVNLHATIDFRNGVFDLTWKGTNTKENVIGLRTHVKQAVFISGDNSTSEVVTKKGKHKQEYRFIDANDPVTNHKWYFGLFDSDVHFSYGDVQNQAYLFAQTDNKHFESPVEWVLLVVDNFLKSALYSPTDGTYGFLLRGEPSATNIDLSVRIKDNIDKNYLLEGTTWISNITYLIRNDNQEVKSWDLNVTVDLNPGHKFVSLKSELLHTISGQEKYKISAVGNKTWTTKGITGVLNFTLDGNSAGVNIAMEGRQSQEQLNTDRKYESCNNVVPFSWPQYYTMACLADYSTIRQYSYNISSNNLPFDLEFLGNFVNIWYYPYSRYTPVSTNTSDLEIKVEFPVESRKIRLIMATPKYKYEVSGVPTKHLEWYGLVPENLVYPRSFLEMYKNENLDYCTVSYVYGHLAKDFFPPEWILYAGDHQQAIYVKNSGENKVAIKVISAKHSLVIVPSEGGYEITKDGEVVPSKEQVCEDWIYYNVISEDVGQPVFGFLPNRLIHFEYYIDRVVIVTQKNIHMTGHCYSYVL